MLSTIIYSGDASMTLGTIVNGEWAFTKNQDRTELVNSFRDQLDKLKIRV
jgi:hypothetical protein